MRATNSFEEVARGMYAQLNITTFNTKSTCLFLYPKRDNFKRKQIEEQVKLSLYFNIIRVSNVRAQIYYEDKKSIDQ